MSKYTVQLCTIVDQCLDDMGLKHDENNWPQIYDKIGLADYPIFKSGGEEYRKILNNKIIRHYWFREIAGETMGQFRWFVRDTMYIIMPYYNQLYESEVIAKNLEPLTQFSRIKNYTDDYKGTASGTASNQGSSEDTINDDNQSVFSDTPQSEMIPNQIKGLKYATNVTLDENQRTANGSSESSGNYSNTGTHNLAHDETEYGYNDSQSKLLLTYRETFLNIDYEIIRNRELADCFLQIW